MNLTSPVQLEDLETSNLSRPPESYRTYCQVNCPAELQATRETYDRLTLHGSSQRVEYLDSCRTNAHFIRHELTGQVRVISHACHLRWCPMCSATRQWFLTQQVTPWIKNALQPKFLTLTLAHSNEQLYLQIQKLYSDFRKYRKLKIFRNVLRGGIWFFQVHKSKNDNCWHPHLHCVIDCSWIDKTKLSEAWELVTKTSKIIRIKEVMDPESMAKEVARYSARPSKLSTLCIDDRLELVKSMHGCRLVGTWGNARSIVLRPSKPPDADQWHEIGSWGFVVNLLGSDDRADAILAAWKNDTPLPKDCDLYYFERYIYDNYQRANLPVEKVWQRPFEFS